MKTKTSIAILGGGPSGMFMFKRLIDTGRTDLDLHIFEKTGQLGSGMPYSATGANEEHITNVSGNEIPELVTNIADWIQTLPQATLDRFRIDPEKFNDYKVLPRLLFGQYLSAQFDLLLLQAKKSGISTQVHFNCAVTNITDHPETRQVNIEVNGKTELPFNQVIICTGHRWPKKQEGKIPGYFDSPYPPSKLEFTANHPVALKGSSLTAIDAIRTLARANGDFATDAKGWVTYKKSADSPDFKLVMHSRSGLLPAIRFHLEDSHLKESLLSDEEIQCNRDENQGFLALDYVFEHNFKASFREKDAAFYEKIKAMDMETFVHSMMSYREHQDPFQLLKIEYREAEKSIRRHESVYWKEMLAALSFAMNYPAKYFSAEDTLRLQKTLMPLISIVIAFVPQSSVKEMLALHESGVLEMVAVGEGGEEEAQPEGGICYRYRDGNDQPQAIYFKTFVDCTGQPHLNFDDVPYTGLHSKQSISPARLKFKTESAGAAEMYQQNSKIEYDQDGGYYLQVPGIRINDAFQVLNMQNEANPRIYMMAVPYIGGFNPDYSGLDFGEAASEKIIESLFTAQTTALPNL